MPSIAPNEVTRAEETHAGVRPDPVVRPAAELAFSVTEATFVARPDGP